MQPRSRRDDAIPAIAPTSPIDRRTALLRLAALSAGPLLAPASTPALANGDQLAAAIREITKGAPVRETGVKLTLPVLAENGNSVPLAVSVESPMTAADHVRAIHIISEKNPVPVIARFRLGPRAGRAEVRTNVRLATGQKVVALAEASDGTFLSATAEVVVTVTACIDAG